MYVVCMIMADKMVFGVVQATPDLEQQPPPQHQHRRTIVNDIARIPGFRFHPTEEELVDYYLRRIVQGKRNPVELIASIDLYQYDPWELPAMALMGEKEWFFFCPRGKKYPKGDRPNRVTASGYWKATGTDRAVRCTAHYRCIGLKKTLVFYTGRAPRGNKTDWIMNEYRMPNPLGAGSNTLTSGSSSLQSDGETCSTTNLITKNDVALCRIYRKSSSTVSSARTYLECAGSREELTVCSSSSHQHQLFSSTENNFPEARAQKITRSCSSQPQFMDFPTKMLQGTTLTSAPDPATLSDSSALAYHDHQAPRAAANSLLSSHAVMARLLEETCCYDPWPKQPKDPNPREQHQIEVHMNGPRTHHQNAMGLDVSDHQRGHDFKLCSSDPKQRSTSAEMINRNLEGDETVFDYLRTFFTCSTTVGTLDQTFRLSLERVSTIAGLLPAGDA